MQTKLSVYLEKINTSSSINFEDDFFKAGKYNAYIATYGSLDYDEEELNMGIEIEMEHTSDPRIARKIALDHLAEFPKYYTALKEMEAKLRRETKNK
jgi:hypothetical protein